MNIQRHGHKQVLCNNGKMESRDLLQMDRLIRLLKRVDENPTVYMTEYNGVRQYNIAHSVIDDILRYATELLTGGPHVHFYRDMVRDAGYPIYPGDVDRCGWLTAYFQMKEGILLFG